MNDDDGIERCDMTTPVGRFKAAMTEPMSVSVSISRDGKHVMFFRCGVLCMEIPSAGLTPMIKILQEAKAYAMSKGCETNC